MHNLSKKYLIFTAWALAMLVALVCYTSYQSAQDLHAKQATALQQDANQIKQLLSDRITIADQTISKLANDLANNPEYASLEQASNNTFSALAAYDDAGQQVLTYGAAIELPIMSDAIKMHLSKGQTAMVLAAKNQETPKVLLLKKLGGNMIIAELDQTQLANHLTASNTQIIADNQTVVLATKTLAAKAAEPQAIAQAVTKHGRSTSGQFDSDGVSHAFSSISLYDIYATNDWIVLTSQPSITLVAILSKSAESMTTKLALAAIGLLSLILLGLSLLTKWRAAHATPQKVNTQTLTKYSDVDVSNNLGNEAHLVNFMHVMAEIDNAILSNAGYERITDLVFTAALKMIPSNFIAKSTLTKNQHHSKTSESSKDLQTNTVVTHANGTKTSYQVNTGKSMRKLFLEHPNGCLIDNPKDHVFLEPFVALGAQNIYALPIYTEGNLSSLLTIGLNPNQTLTNFEETCARNLANRLGVAKTATVLKNELYIREYFDQVTNLYNRQACRDRLSQEMSRARRQKTKLATFYVQLEGLKKINDSAGSAIVDEVLKEIGESLTTNMREADVIARFSDNEFIIVISDIEKTEHANRVADKIFGLLAKPIHVAESEFYVSSHTGISIFPDDGMTVDEMINHANHAMFSAKKDNTSHYAFYEENMSAHQIHKIALEKDLRAGLLKDELYMVYQPQVNARNGNIIGVEALMRWEHPDRGAIGPIEFIKVAEETGLIVQLGQHGRKQACEQYAKWAAEGIAPLSMALNVSSYEIQRKEFVPELKKLLADTQVPPQALELEITESLLIDNSGNVTENIQSLHDLGIRIAIDDFGTGYSNLSYLVRFPFDVLKIDKAFMQGIGGHSGSTQIVAMIIDMAHHLGKTVCAEGVETEVQRRFLLNAGCDSIQGYLISKPLDVDKLERFMIQNNAAQSSAISLPKALDVAIHHYN